MKTLLTTAKSETLPVPKDPKTVRGMLDKVKKEKDPLLASMPLLCFCVTGIPAQNVARALKLFSSTGIEAERSITRGSIRVRTDLEFALQRCSDA